MGRKCYSEGNGDFDLLKNQQIESLQAVASVANGPAQFLNRTCQIVCSLTIICQTLALHLYEAALNLIDANVETCLRLLSLNIDLLRHEKFRSYRLEG